MRSTGPRHSDVRLIVAAGGTGGHIYPAVTTVRALREELASSGRRLDVLWVGQAGGLESRIAASEGIRFAAVATGKIRRAANPLKMVTRDNVVDMLRLPRGIAEAWRTVGRFRPDVVLTTGGYVTVPVGLAAWLRRRPLVVHEQTVRVGLANRLLARLANRVALSSESSLTLLPGRAAAKSAIIGNPVRPELFDGDADKAVVAVGADGFDRSLPTVYVTGGAQGAVQINRVVRELLPWLLQRANVIHQCGKASITELREHAATLDSVLGARLSLNRWTQHPRSRRVCGKAIGLDARGHWTSADAVAGSSRFTAGRGAVVLGQDRRGHAPRRSRCRSRGIASQGQPLVPRCWRDVTVFVAAAKRPLPVLCRA
ncbi:glycosyltransferase [Nocardia asteroides]|nr:glycosyltransferase [Nocardia asteroides]